MSGEEIALALMEEFQHVFLGDQDIAKLLSMLDQDIIWIGWRKKDRYQGLEAVKAMLMNPSNSMLPPFVVEQHQYQAIPVAAEAYLISGRMIGRDMEVRISAFCKMVGPVLKLVYLHFALCDEPRDQAILAKQLSQEENCALSQVFQKRELEMEERNQELEVLTKNIPGGMFRCLFDEALTILYMSEGFLSLFGYTREEIRDKFQNSFWNMILPCDRDMVWQEVVQQLQNGDTKDIEYRVTCKDGRTIWVFDKGQLIREENGESYFCCIVLDNTNVKMAQEELQLSLDRHRIIMDQTNDIIFEWDMRSDQLTFSSNWEKKLGYHPITNNIQQRYLKESHLHPDDISVFSHLMHQVLQGVPYTEGELRITREDGLSIWFKVRVTTQHDDLGQLVKAVGVLIDIDEEKKVAQQLREKAERDTLTKLYNKGTAQTMIDHYIKGNPEKECGFLIIDIDNFKQINDSLGHLFGDAYLSEIAIQMQKLFRNTDIIGRIGGDEFIVFMQDITGVDFVLQKAQDIIVAFQEIHAEQKNTITISCSIGIALYPQNGRGFQKLYRNADYALYQAKNQGKNCYVLYQPPGDEDTCWPRPSTVTAVNEKIDSNTNVKVLDSQFVEYIFSILFQAKDIATAVYPMMEIVGRRFNVSRVYIFENTEDGKYSNNTFEWCNEGVAPEIQHLQKMPLKNYVDNFTEEGIFYCRDIRELPPDQYEILAAQNIKSLLQCSIGDRGEFKGFIGFDECISNRLWTQQQIDSLSFIAKILGIFLLKQRTQERLLQAAEGLKAVLDNQNSWIYVISPHTYEILYLNHKTLSFVPQARLGISCYEAFFKRHQPCGYCPVQKLEASPNDYCTLEVYNPVLGVWSLADASRILWQGETAYLLCCHDISQYKT